MRRPKTTAQLMTIAYENLYLRRKLLRAAQALKRCERVFSTLAYRQKDQERADAARREAMMAALDRVEGRS